MSIDRRESSIENCEDPVLFGSRPALCQASCAALKNCSALEAFGPATGLNPSVIRAARGECGWGRAAEQEWGSWLLHWLGVEDRSRDFEKLAMEFDWVGSP